MVLRSEKVRDSATVTAKENNLRFVVWYKVTQDDVSLIFSNIKLHPLLFVSYGTKTPKSYIRGCFVIIYLGVCFFYYKAPPDRHFHGARDT